MEDKVLLKENPILVVDDNENNRLVLRRGLIQEGHGVVEAENGRVAMDLIQENEFDLILLDIMMPELNGFQVLEMLNLNETWKNIPVIIISAATDIESVVKCIELGADDYLTKPFNRIVLQARVQASLEKKRLRNKEQSYLSQIEFERERSEKLLRNMLPESIAERLKNEDQTIADHFEDASILFSDIVGFTRISSMISPVDLVSMLNEIFFELDELTEKYGLEKIKTIGDAYLVAGGIPEPNAGHLGAIGELALEMPKVLEHIKFGGDNLEMRSGIHCGPVVAGVIGRKKYIYDIWGDTVNVASRFSDIASPGQIMVTDAVNQRLEDKFVLEDYGMVDVKGRGELRAYLLEGKK